MDQHIYVFLNDKINLITKVIKRNTGLTIELYDSKSLLKILLYIITRNEIPICYD